MWLAPATSPPRATDDFRFDTFRRAETPALVAEIERLGPESPETPNLLVLLGTSGAPDRALPLLLRWSERAGPVASDLRYGTFFALSFSHDPRARRAVARSVRLDSSVGRDAQTTDWLEVRSGDPAAVRRARAAR